MRRVQPAFPATANCRSYQWLLHDRSQRASMRCPAGTVSVRAALPYATSVTVTVSAPVPALAIVTYTSPLAVS